MNPRALVCSCLSLLAVSAHAQFALTEINGGPFADNLSTLPGSSAFGKDEIAGGGIPIHKIPNVRDGVYGNGNSWIGDSPNSFIGISFGATPLPIGRFALGRDNNVDDGAIHTDRTAGAYTLQYTTTPNPDAATPDAVWLTIGSFTQGAGDAGLYSASRRHSFNFAPVNATGIRLITPGSSFADGAAIDELEVAAFAPAPMTLLNTAGAMDAATNIALAANGGVPFAKDLIRDGFYAPTHTIPNLNDGVYGNPNSWIGETQDSFAGVRFGLAQTIIRVAFGRDNTGMFPDRADGIYVVQFTRALNPDATTPDASWSDIGAVFIDSAAADRGLRHEYAFDPIVGATALRIITPGQGEPNGGAIDELEVYAVPEPTTGAIALLGLALLGLNRRRAGVR